MPIRVRVCVHVLFTSQVNNHAGIRAGVRVLYLYLPGIDIIVCVCGRVTRRRRHVCVRACVYTWAGVRQHVLNKTCLYLTILTANDLRPI